MPLPLVHRNPRRAPRDLLFIPFSGLLRSIQKALLFSPSAVCFKHHLLKPGPVAQPLHGLGRSASCVRPVSSPMRLIDSASSSFVAICSSLSHTLRSVFFRPSMPSFSPLYC